MAENSKIEWTHHTANLWHGCTKVHAGCDHCYAETLSRRWKRDIWGNDKPRMAIQSVWNDFKKYQAAAAAAGEIHRVFVGSMMDIFEKPMPIVDSHGNPGIDANDGSPFETDCLRDRYFEEIIPATPNLLHLMLTKRPSNINKMIPESWKENPPANVMFGTSPCDQATADTLVQQLLQVKGKRFLSIEPLLGPIDISKYLVPIGVHHHPKNKLTGDIGIALNKMINLVNPDLKKRIDWVIVGGESGHDARPMHPDWVRSLREQCDASKVPFFFKQWGNLLPLCQERSADPLLGTVPATIVEFPSPHNPSKKNKYYRLPKHVAGRLLDGRLHDHFPPNNY